MRVSLNLKRCLLILCAAPVLAGCSGTRLFQWFGDEEIPTADADHPVTRIVCVWEPSEGRGVDGLPARGFAGQVMFFTHRDASPMKVEGDVRIYVFDDQGSLEQQGRPIHQFDFKRTEHGDAWNRHLAVGSLGPWYQLFIPYTRKGSHQARCALQVRYTPPGGAPVFSDLATVVLPGRLDESYDPRLTPVPPYDEGESRTATAVAPLSATVGHSPQAAVTTSSPLRQFGQRVGLLERPTPGRTGPTRVYADQAHAPTGRVSASAESSTAFSRQAAGELPQHVDGRIHLASGTIDPRAASRQVPAIPPASAMPESRLDRIERMLEGLALAQQSPSAGHSGTPGQRPTARVEPGATADLEPSPDAWGFSAGAAHDGEPRRLDHSASRGARGVPRPAPRVHMPRIPQFQSSQATGYRPTTVDRAAPPSTEYHPLGGSHPLSSERTTW